MPTARGAGHACVKTFTVKFEFMSVSRPSRAVSSPRLRSRGVSQQFEQVKQKILLHLAKIPRTNKTHTHAEHARSTSTT